MNTSGDDGWTTKAVGYGRVSTQKQAEDGHSLDEQERAIRLYCESQGWALVGMFVDGGISGSVRERPELTRLIEAVRAGDADRVVVRSLDRLGRSLTNLVNLIDELEGLGAAVAFLSPAIDTSRADGRLLRNILASVAEFERELIRERVSRSAVERARKGGSHGGPRVFGYVSKKKVLRVKPHEAAVVRRIFDEFAAGKSQLAIARDLTRDGISPPRAANGWHQSSVGRVLRNETYLGRTRLKGWSTRGAMRPSSRRRSGRTRPRSSPPPTQRVGRDAAGRAAASRFGGSSGAAAAAAR